MHDSPSLSPVEVVVLTRLLPVGPKGETTARIQKDLEPLLGRRWSGPALTSQIERTLIKLTSAGLVTQRPGKTKRAAPVAELTASGQEATLSFFRLKQLPAKPKPTWASLKKSLLLAPALGLPRPGQALAKDDALRAALLKRQFDLPLDDYPTLKQAKTEWLRKTLGLGAKEKVTLETVQAALLRRELGDGDGRGLAAKRVLDRLLARHLRAPRDDTKELRDEVVRKWIDGGVAVAPPAPPAPSLDLDCFSESVLDAAGACPTGRYGDGKVFIAHVWRALQDRPEFRGMDLPTFKQRLAEANNARLLDLSRADLVQAMDPEDVRRSEVQYLNAMFHFIRLDPGREPRR
jgi:hypothetical protein